jgi:hypothetical protein
VVSLFASDTAQFTLCAILLGVLVARPTGNRPRSLRLLAGTGLVWTLAFSVNYATILRPVAGSEYMQRYWAPSYLSLTAPGVLTHFSRASLEVVEAGLFGRLGVGRGLFLSLTVLLACVGLVALGRRHHPATSLILAGAPLAGLAAALVGFYPLSTRTFAFVTPCLCIMIAAGLGSVARRIPGRARAWVATLGAVLLVAPAAGFIASGGLAAAHAAAFGRLTTTLKEQAGQGEPIYIYARDVPLWTYYTTNWSSPESGRTARLMRMAESLGPNSGNVSSRGRRVSGEGSGLTVQDGDHLDIIGVPTGIFYRSRPETATRRPDPGWATNEVQRMLAVAKTRIWLVLPARGDPASVALLHELAAVGARCRFERCVPANCLFEYGFPARN